MFKTVKFNVIPDFAIALCTGECSHLSDTEVSHLDEWQNNKQDGREGKWFIEDVEIIGKCEVAGTFSDLMQVSWNYKD